MKTDPGRVGKPDEMTQPVEPIFPRRARAFTLAILAIIAIAAALGVWTIALIEVEIVPPNVGTCGVVFTEIVLPHANDDYEVSPTLCSEALAPAVQEAETVFWVTVGFDVVGIPAIIALAVKRRRLRLAAYAAAGQEPTPWRIRLRVARIAWIALGVSVAAVGLLLLALQTAGDAVEYAGRPDAPLGVVLSPLFVVLAFAAIVSAIGLNTAAGTRGLGSRLIGILGGLILLSPILAMAAAPLVLPLCCP